MAYFMYQNKKVFYKVTGSGDPLLLLHGNTASSKMFRFLLKMYRTAFRVILIDFPGHGRSERIDRFEKDFWFYNADVVNSLIDVLKLAHVSVIGTSGGALVGINLALEHPEKVKYLVADSFEGAYPLASYIDSLVSDREKDKRKWLAKLFWLYCHGLDWRRVVDQDTEMNIAFAKTGKSFFHRSISELKVPALLTGSKEDEYCHDLDKIYGELKDKNGNLEIELFESGNHPAMLSNKETFFALVKEKIKNENQ